MVTAIRYILLAVVCLGLLPRLAGAATATYGDYIITADHISFNTETQIVVAKGNVRMKTPDGIFSAVEATYDTKTRQGVLTDATGGIQPYIFSARQVHYGGDTTMHIDEASLTTCVQQHPHYRLIARRVDLNKNGDIVARRVTLEVGGHRTITLPVIHGNPLERERANAIAHPSQYVGTSALDGYYMATRYQADIDRDTIVSLEGRVGTENLFRGGVYLRHAFTLPGQTGLSHAAVMVTRKEDVENRMVEGGREAINFPLEKLAISRQPGIQVALAPLPLPGSLKPFSVSLGGSAGYYREEPTGIGYARGQLQAVVNSPLVKLGPANLFVQYGAATAMAGGLLHLSHAGAITLETRPDFPVYGCLSFVRRREAGHSPFTFDRVLIPDELISEVEVPLVPGGLFRLNVWNRLDTGTKKFRDLGASLIMHTDCISYGLNYNLAMKSFSGGIVLNALGDFHHGAGWVAFTQ
jgi:hypothetical protein